MSVDRRRLLTAAAAALAAPPLAALPAAAQTPAPTPLTERLGAAAAANRHRLEHAGGRFSGPAWDLLLERGRGAHAFLLGEEHGIAENPRLAAALYEALVPAGYDQVAIEVSPPMATELDRAAQQGVDGLRRLFADPGSQVAFFGMREEALWLAAARAAGPAGRPLLWGLDYEVGADRRLIAQLGEATMPPAARQALAALKAASDASWALYARTGGPQHIFSFAGDPALVRAIRDAWPSPDPASAWRLETLEETFAINQLWVAGEVRQSNLRRAQFNRSNLLRHWRAAREAGRSPKVFYKFGAGHMVRGLSPTTVFDIGSLAPELAAIDGGHSYHLLVLPGAGSEVATFDPTAWTYRAAPAGPFRSGLEPILDQAWADAFTLIDLQPLRAMVSGARLDEATPDLIRMVHGFDAVLVMSGSTPSTNL